eukprot:4137657-Ditylum_brightwellii.AAC.1
MGWPSWPSCPLRLCCVSTTIVRPVLHLEACGAQMCPDVVVVVKKDGEGKLEAPSSVSLLHSKIGGAGCFALSYGFVSKGEFWVSPIFTHLQSKGVGCKSRGFE